jgi:hypothetical protein
MVALLSSDVTVTVNERRIYGTGKKRRNRVTLTYGDGAKTYPTGGVPMPAFGSFGLIRQMDYLVVVDQSSADGFVYKYDVTNNKLKIFVEQAVGTNTPLAEASAALAPAATTVICEAVGW